MFPPFDSKFFDQFNMNPASFLSKIADFQRANLEAAREIAENNARAFQQLATIRDPQSFVTMQPAVIQAAMERNSQIIAQLWQSLGADLNPPPAAKPSKK